MISDSGTGGLRISASADLEIMNSSATETKAKFTTDGAVELYYDNVKKFETTSTGVSMIAEHDHQQMTGFEDPLLILQRISSSPAVDLLGSIKRRK